MALQLRRGTNAERLAITPATGELIYVTDHISLGVQPLWVGDGVTPGGNSNTTASNITLLSSSTNVSIVPLAIESQSTGTPAPGFGPSMIFRSETAPGNTERIGDINFILSDVTSGSEDAYVDIGLIVNGTSSVKAAEIANTKVKFSGSELVINSSFNSSGLPVGNSGTAQITALSSNINLGSPLNGALNWDGYRWSFGDYNGTSTLEPGNFGPLVNNTTTPKGCGGLVNTDDFWFFGGVDEGSNGALVIGTGKDGNEPIYVRQGMGGSGANVTDFPGSAYHTRQLTLLNAEGKTILPGPLCTESHEQIYLTTGVALSLTKAASYFVTGATNATSTLAVGSDGQFKTLAMKTDGGGDMVVTVSNAGWVGTSPYTGTITFNNIGDSCLLHCLFGTWYAVGANGVTFA